MFFSVTSAFMSFFEFLAGKDKTETEVQTNASIPEPIVRKGDGMMPLNSFIHKYYMVKYFSYTTIPNVTSYIKYSIHTVYFGWKT